MSGVGFLNLPITVWRLASQSGAILHESVSSNHLRDTTFFFEYSSPNHRARQRELAVIRRSCHPKKQPRMASLNFFKVYKFSDCIITATFRNISFNILPFNLNFFPDIDRIFPISFNIKFSIRIYIYKKSMIFSV